MLHFMTFISKKVKIRQDILHIYLEAEEMEGGDEDDSVARADSTEASEDNIDLVDHCHLRNHLNLQRLHFQILPDPT